MKSLLLMLSCVALIGTAACTHKATTVAPTRTAPASGARFISFFSHNDTDMTQHLAGYTFDFQGNGVLQVNTGLQNLTGSWAQQYDDSHTELTINIPGADEMLAELNEEFIIQQNSDAALWLSHDHESENHHLRVHFTRQ